MTLGERIKHPLHPHYSHHGHHKEEKLVVDPHAAAIPVAVPGTQPIVVPLPGTGTVPVTIPGLEQGLDHPVYVPVDCLPPGTLIPMLDGTTATYQNGHLVPVPGGKVETVPLPAIHSNDAPIGSHLAPNFTTPENTAAPNTGIVPGTGYTPVPAPVALPGVAGLAPHTVPAPVPAPVTREVPHEEKHHHHHHVPVPVPIPVPVPHHHHEEAKSQQLVHEQPRELPHEEQPKHVVVSVPGKKVLGEDHDVHKHTVVPVPIPISHHHDEKPREVDVHHEEQPKHVVVSVPGKKVLDEDHDTHKHTVIPAVVPISHHHDEKSRDLPTETVVHNPHQPDVHAGIAPTHDEHKHTTVVPAVVPISHHHDENSRDLPTDTVIHNPHQPDVHAGIAPPTHDEHKHTTVVPAVVPISHHHDEKPRDLHAGTHTEAHHGAPQVGVFDGNTPDVHAGIAVPAGAQNDETVSRAIDVHSKPATGVVDKSSLGKINTDTDHIRGIDSNIAHCEASAAAAGAGAGLAAHHDDHTNKAHETHKNDDHTTTHHTEQHHEQTRDIGSANHAHGNKHDVFTGETPDTHAGIQGGMNTGNKPAGFHVPSEVKHDIPVNSSDFTNNDHANPSK